MCAACRNPADPSRVAPPPLPDAGPRLELVPSLGNTPSPISEGGVFGVLDITQTSDDGPLRSSRTTER